MTITHCKETVHVRQWRREDGSGELVPHAGWIMEKADWLLLAVGDRIEPIQLQKTVFKFAMESKVREPEAYEFVPYNWGPCSFEIYDDLDTLRSGGLIQSVASGRGWQAYQWTSRGAIEAKALRAKADPELVREFDSAREYVTNRSFTTLLRDIYEDYPEFAKNSLFK